MRILSIIVMMLYAGAAASASTFERQVPADPTGRVEISNVSGLVEITGWDRSEVDVKAEIDDESDRVEVSSRKGATSIKVVKPSSPSEAGDTTLRVRVPKGSEVEVTVVTADIRSSDVLGVQRLRTVSGNIVAEVAQAEAEVKTVSGDTVLQGSGKPTRVRVSSVSGDVNYERGAGDLEATMVSGDLRATLDPARSVRVRTTSGDVTLRGKLASGASVEAEAISGQLVLQTKLEAGLRYEATSFSGDIETCFGNSEVERTSQYGPGSRLSGSTGAGKADLRFKTLSGEVSICDR
jgi:DUF4097 and DUF4098 domain-containing protein YvlB